MKWLKIKKYLKIFSVIICSIFIFSNIVLAKEKIYTYEDDYIKYLKDNLDYDFFKNKSNELINYIESNTDYDFVISFYMDSGYPQLRLNVIFFDDINNILIGASDYDSNTLSFELTLKNINNNYFNYKNLETGFDFKDINNENISQMFLDMKAKIDDFILKKDFSNHKEIDYFTYIRQRYNLYSSDLKIPLYSTKNLLYNNNTKYNNEINIQINDYLFTNNSTLNELIEHFDILGNKENPLKYRMQFNNDVSPDLKQITFDFSSYEFTEGSNPVKTKIEIGSWNEDVSLSNYLSQVITGYGLDNIETDLTSYFDISIDTTDYLTTKELTFTYTLKQDLPSDILRLKVYYDFETFDDNYYFNVFDNTSWGSPDWRYIENFLVGYKKYTFPDGYDLAIIRSKSFKDLESFYISDKLYFTNPDYDFNLKLYDFNNKIEKYNFNSLTQYLINPVYLKIPIKIDETNNIFPVLTKPMNNESGVFYLKDDLFVQFVNSENLDSIIEGIPENDFNDNNDLNIDSDIGNLNPPQQDEQSLTVFFNEFWKMFEKFSDILSYITSCFTQFFISLPTTIQFFLCISFAFVIYKMIVFFIL